MKANTAKGQWALVGLIEQVKAVCEIEPGPNGCWIWRYGTWKYSESPGKCRYPRLMIGGVRKHVSDWVLIATGKPQPPGEEACHSCDRTACVNPAHLRWDTHKRNMEEMGDRGRAGPTQHPESRKWADDHPWRLNPALIPRGPRPGNYAKGDEHYARRRPDLVKRGEAVPNARLNADKVREIRRRRKAGEGPTLIAWRLGVGTSTVQAVLDGRTWKHVT